MSTAFESSTSLWNCQMFPYIAGQWQVNNLTASAIQIAASAGYANASSTIRDAVYNTTANCLSSYGNPTWFDLADNSASEPRRYLNICSMEYEFDVNPDIFGIGVRPAALFSHSILINVQIRLGNVMQLALALITFWYSRMCECWIGRIYRLTTLVFRHDLSHYKSVQGRARAHLKPILDATHELQKAQAFFTIGVMIAGMLYIDRRNDIGTTSIGNILYSRESLSFMAGDFRGTLCRLV
ncbi:MAG: hypothetical protein Q9162_005801 [Coniocarpon cinnabarinum]